MAMPTSASAPSSPAPAKSQVGKAVCLLILLGILSYCNSLTRPFHLDDVWITDSPAIGSAADYVGGMLNRFLVGFTLHLHYRVHGLDVFGYHLGNMAIHIFAALTLFGLVRFTLLLPLWSARFNASASWLAFSVAFVWMAHPLQTQAVTYIIQRCESLMGLCFLLTIYCALRSTESAHPWGWHLGSLLCFALGLGTKEVIVTVVPILLAYDRIFLAPWSEIARRRWHFYFALIGVSTLPFSMALPALLGDQHSRSGGFHLFEIRPEHYWMTQAKVLLYYLGLCFFPYPQIFRHQSWPLTVDFNSFFWPAGLLIGSLLLLTWWLLSRRSWLGFLGLWFFGILSVTSIIPLIDVAFEFRLYLPLAAVCVLVVIGGHLGIVTLYSLHSCRELSRAGTSKEAQCVSSSSTAIAFTVGMACTLGSALTILTLNRNEDYQDASTLYASVEEAYPKCLNSLFWIAFGNEQEEQADRAFVYYAKMLAIEPNQSAALHRTGMLLCRMDKTQEGVKRVVPYDEKHPPAEDNNETDSLPDMVTSRTGLGPFEIGLVHAILGRWNQATVHLCRSASLQPHRADRHAALALALKKVGRLEEAQTQVQLALSLDNRWGIHARRMAEHRLHRSAASDWMCQEALFYALQSAEATRYQNPFILNSLAQAYVAAGHAEDAKTVLARPMPGIPNAQREEWLDQLARVNAFYRAHPAGIP